MMMRKTEICFEIHDILMVLVVIGNARGTNRRGVGTSGKDRSGALEGPVMV